MKSEQKAILDACRIIVENQIKNLKYNYYIDGIVIKKNSDGTYNIKNSGNTFENIKARTGLVLSEGDSVQIMIKNGDFNNKFIDDQI